MSWASPMMTVTTTLICWEGEGVTDVVAAVVLGEGEDRDEVVVGAEAIRTSIIINQEQL